MQILFSKGCSIIGLNIYKLCIIIGELLKTQQNSLLPQPEQQSRFHILRWQYGNYLVFSHLPTAGQPRAGRHILALSPRREFTVLFCFFLEIVCIYPQHPREQHICISTAKTVTVQSSIASYSILCCKDNPVTLGFFP